MTSLEDLYDGSEVRQFSNLRGRFDLLETDLFQYRQITHLLKKISSKQQAIPTSVLRFLSLPSQSKIRGSKIFYNLYTDNDTLIKTSNILKWEKELGKTFTPAQWQAAITSSSCANHKEKFHKRLTRWYFTPLRIATAYPAASPYCWRSCGSAGSLLHVFWSCPCLTPFWDNVKGLVSQMTQKLCTFGPEFFLLLLNIESIPQKNRKIVCNILHAARLLIARRWKSPDIPSLLELSNMVSTIFSYEKALATYQGSLVTFMKNWVSWLQLFPNLS